jgi:hypothetical protein
LTIPKTVLLDLGGIGPRDLKIPCERHLYFDLFADGLLQEGGDLVNHLIQVDVLGLQDLTPRIGEVLSTQCASACCLLAYVSKQLGLGAV